MSSYPDMPDRLTTDQLLAEIERLLGYRPTPVQLRQWVKAGLIPDSQRVYPGRGHGEGSVALWEPQTRERVFIVLHARTGRTGKNVAVDRARLLLAVLGWPPIPTRWCKRPLTDMLSGLVWDFEEFIRPNRPPQSQPPADAPRRVARSIRARVNTAPGVQDMPRPDRAAAFRLAAAVAGQSDPAASDALSQLSRFFAPERLRTALAQSSEERVLACYAEAGSWLDTTLPFFESLAQSLAGNVGQRPMRMHYTDTLPRSDDFTTADVLRLPATLGLVAYHHYGSEAEAAVQHAIPDLMRFLGPSGSETRGEDATPRTAGPQES